MELQKIAEEHHVQAREGITQQELVGLTESENAPLSLDELDIVAGGAAGADSVEIDGQIVEFLPHGLFQVQFDDGTAVQCRLSVQLRMSLIRVLPGDRVRVETWRSLPSHR